MSQYYWEADGGDVGGAPSNMTYSQPWDTTNPWTTVEVATYSGHVDFDYCLKLAIASPPESSRRLLEISAVNGNSISDAATVEIYAVLDVDSQYSQVGVGGRTDGSEGSETGIVSRAQLNSADTDVIEYDGGSFTQLEANVSGVSYDTPMAVRLQMDGTAVKYRIWEYGTGEPGTWDSETSSTGLTSSGGVGLFNFTAYGEIYLVAFGVGTGGDSAPTEEVSGGDVNVNAGTTGLTLTTNAASVQYDVEVSAGTTALTITTQKATVDVSTDVDVQADAASLTLTTYPATVELHVGVDAGTTNLSISTNPATVELNVGVSAGVKALTLTTYNPTVTYTVVNIDVSAGVAALTLTTYRANVSGVRPEPSRDTLGVGLNLAPPPRQIDDLNSWQWKEWIFTLYQEVNKLVTNVIVDGEGNVRIGREVLATDATDGFFYIPTCAGTPTGTPSEKTGTIPLVYDTTNEKLYIYNGSWVSVTLT